MKLTQGHKTILEQINDFDNPSTPDLEEDEKILEHYEPTSISRTLRKLEKNGYVDKQSGRPNTYSLTDDGFTIVKKRRNRRKRRIKKAAEQNNGFQFRDAVEAFEEYFRIDRVEQRLAQDSLESPIAAINYSDLERFNPDIADKVIDEPEKMIGAAEAAVTRLSAIEREMDVRFTDLPEYHEKKIRQIGTADVHKLITVPGIVLKASMTRPILVNATFKCSACGERQDREQEEGKLTSPYKCECGNRHFKTVNKEFDDVRILKLQEKPDSPDKKTIKVRVFGSMANEEVITEMNPGTSIRLTGIVKAEEPSNKNDPYYNLYLAAVDVDEDENKWADIELTDTDRQRNQEIADTGAAEVFHNSLAVDRVIHRELMKEAFLLYLLGKTDGGNLNVLVMGEPGTGKSMLNNWAEQHFPKTIKAVAQSSTGVGLTATVKEDKDFGGYVAQGGSLTLADGGYHITDEFDKIDPDDVANFNEALASGTITLNKGDITNLKLQANVSEWATANPRNQDYFDPYTPKYEQIPIPPKFDATKDRFDVIIGLDAYESDDDRKEDVARHILNRGTEGYEEAEPEYPPEALVKFVTQASRITPEISDSAEEKIFDVFFALKAMEEDEQRLITNRKLYALKKLSIAYARMDLSETVDESHAKSACKFFRDALESIDFTIGKDSFSEVVTAAANARRDVCDAIEQCLNDDGTALIGDILDEVDLDEEKVDELITDMMREGEAMKPKPDRIRLL
jgi:replicative DNA helicase Mcm